MSHALIGTDEDLHAIRNEMAKEAGLPRRGAVVGGRDYLPREYAPGAAGWTDHVVAEPFDTDKGERAMEIPEDMKIPDGYKAVDVVKAVFDDGAIVKHE